MLGLTINLGASKDQICCTETGDVLIDRYVLRNKVKRVQVYKPVDLKANDANTLSTHRPIGMEYVPDPSKAYIKTAEGMIRMHMQA